MGQALLLIGRPGIGKTTIVRAVVEQLGASAGGFYTQEIREAGKRSGFRMVGIPEGHAPSAVLASVNSRGPHRVGSYRVNLDNLERVGTGAVSQAIRDPAILVVVIDEIGKMELFSLAFRQSVVDALDSPKPVVATVMAARDAWVEAVTTRSDVSLVQVTLANREVLPNQILTWLDGVQGKRLSGVGPRAA